MSYESIIIAAAKAAKVSTALFFAICSHESGIKNILTKNDGGSPTYGVCQVKFETAKMMGYKGEPFGLMDPATNAKYGARYLKYQEKRYGDDWCKITAAYNAGSVFIEKRSKRLKNLQYVHKVQEKLQEDLRPKLECDTVNK